MLDVTDQYMAGVLDGEACFAFYRRHHVKGDFWQYRITIEMVCKPLVECFYQKYGGNFRKAPKPKCEKYRQKWRWCLESKADILRVIPIILPYLIEKREQAELMWLALNNKIPKEEAVTKIGELKKIEWLD